ncbi:MAG: signal peptidase I [Fidelibacterota bacterium]
MSFVKILREIRALLIIVVIVLLLKVTLVEAYIVPTGSMENTIMTGDFLIGNRFIYGMRTPDWIGIPYTDIGFDVPYIRFPKFREPQPGEVLIFKYPRDPHVKYVKRCIAGPGDTVAIKARRVFVNGHEFPLPEHGRFGGHMRPPNERDPLIFLGTQGNKDYFRPLPIPRKGEVIPVGPETALLVMQLMLLDGHELVLRNQGRSYRFTMTDPDDLYRRKESPEVYRRYYPQGTLVNPWMTKLPAGELFLDGKPITGMDSYTVEQNYYWMMGDNRDDSFDSRFWGFVPERYILGKALLAYMSLDLDTWIPRFNRIGTVIR